ncbi:hypothetical protein [Corynebacterium glyciniphilum]|uniref:hypothetical protein n=1 Tax=Corynebacterium glyciniphilum TaxID=1404244 RepID=UPI0011AB3643|nr:hypothetical protein [Corynebacterium glyciniphilum]
MGYQGHALDSDIIRQWSVPTRVHRTIRPDTLENHCGRARGVRADAFTDVGGFWIPTTAVRDAGVVKLGAREHPRGIAYDLEALTRARLTHIAHPGWTGAAWSAASVWGMPYFCDDADTCVLSGGDRRIATHAGETTRHRRAGWMTDLPSVVNVDPEFPRLPVTSPVLTIIHCLRSLRSGEHSWSVLPGTGKDDVTVRSVQFIDAACQLFSIDPVVLVDACAGLYPGRDLRRMVSLADRGGESPMETLLRLQIYGLFGREVADRFIPQLVVCSDGTTSDPVHTGERVTGRVAARVDLGCAEWKLALQYDGADHLARNRRDTDSRIGAELANLGWHVLRLTYGHLKDPELLRRTLVDGIMLARRRLR